MSGSSVMTGFIFIIEPGMLSICRGFDTIIDGDEPRLVETARRLFAVICAHPVSRSLKDFPED